MAKEVRTRIINEIKVARYFSISVDSTPDISHVDQLTIIIRYVSPSCHEPVERFLTFLPIHSHTGENLANALLTFLGVSGLGLDIAHCRGQSYDNASNMSGRYSGMQAKIKEVNSQAVYIPCAAHSLNLVGQSAVDCCIEAVTFFSLVQQIYVFFSASTKRWHTLTDSLDSKGCKVPKRPSDTRWSAHASATEALHAGYSVFESTLDSMANNTENNADCRHEARTLCNAMGHLETALMCEMWNDILQRFNMCSKSLQDAKIDIACATALLSSLDDFLIGIRDLFDDYEKRAIDLCDNDTYKAETTRIRKRKQQVNDGGAADVLQLVPRDKFRINTFNVIVDKLRSSLQHRANAYESVSKRFRVLTQHHSMSDQEIIENVRLLASFYGPDLDDDLNIIFNEFKQFFHFTQKYGATVGLHADVEGQGHSTSSVQRMYILLKTSGVDESFSNVEVILRIYLSLLVTNCSGERSFSQLKRIKNELRSTMHQERLAALSLMCIENDVVRQLNFNDIIDQFAAAKARSVHV
jgi:hypothetical protein